MNSCKALEVSNATLNLRAGVALRHSSINTCSACKLVSWLKGTIGLGYRLEAASESEENGHNSPKANLSEFLVFASGQKKFVRS